MGEKPICPECGKGRLYGRADRMLRCPHCGYEVAKSNTWLRDLLTKMHADVDAGRERITPPPGKGHFE